MLLKFVFFFPLRFLEEMFLVPTGNVYMSNDANIF